MAQRTLLAALADDIVLMLGRLGTRMKDTRDLGQRLGKAARQAGAHPQTTHDDGQSVDQFLALIDPTRERKHRSTVNGQAALKAAAGSRELASEPVEAFAQLVVGWTRPAPPASPQARHKRA